VLVRERVADFGDQSIWGENDLTNNGTQRELGKFDGKEAKRIFGSVRKRREESKARINIRKGHIDDAGALQKKRSTRKRGNEGPQERVRGGISYKRRFAQKREYERHITFSKKTRRTCRPEGDIGDQELSMPAEIKKV